MLWTYLKASYRYRLFRHLRLLAVSVCLLVLPISLLIYRDSMAHGTELYNSRPQEYDILIINAGTEHLPHFEHIPNLSYEVRADSIGVSVLEEVFSAPENTALDIEGLEILWNSDVLSASNLAYEFLYEAIEHAGDKNIFLFSGQETV